MDKAYDFSVLLAKFKNIGLEVTEDAAKKMINELFVWLDESADLSATKYDDLLKVVYPMVKKEILDAADGIHKA